MTVKGNAQITLTDVTDIKATTTYYKLQDSSLAPPAAPTLNPPDGWSTTEPTYEGGNTDRLYLVTQTLWSNDTFDYSDVSLSSSYEAAKAAYNKAQAAGTTAQAAQSAADAAKSDAANVRTDMTQAITDTRDDALDTVSKTYATQTDLSGAQDIITKSIKDLMDGYELDFAHSQKQINDLSSSANSQFATISKYIRFQDGKILLGESGNEITLLIDADRISFRQAGAEIAYFSGSKLHVPTSIRLGNFAFAPRSNGSLDFKKVT